MNAKVVLQKITGSFSNICKEEDKSTASKVFQALDDDVQGHRNFLFTLFVNHFKSMMNRSDPVMKI